LLDTIRSRKDVWYVLVMLSLSGIGIFVYGVYDFFVIRDLTLPGRLDAFFTSPNYVSLYGVPIAVVIAGALLHVIANPAGVKQSSRSFIPVLIATAISLIALFLTFSLAGWIALLIGGLGLILFLTQGKMRIALLGLVALVVIAGGVHRGMTVGLFHYNQEYGISSFDTRVDIWRVSGKLLAQHPIKGVGLGQFKQEFQDYTLTHLEEFPRQIDWRNASHPHNFFFEFLD